MTIPPRRCEGLMWVKLSFSLEDKLGNTEQQLKGTAKQNPHQLSHGTTAQVLGFSWIPWLNITPVEKLWTSCHDP